MWADLALTKLLEHDFHTVIDIGSGLGEHAHILKQYGKDVTTISLEPPADIIADFMQVDLEPVDCIWASHVLEHQPNPNSFLKKCYSLLKDDGLLSVTVPPAKHSIVGGHVNLYNAGLLLYQMILSGFDCSQASVKSYGYNISVIVRKKKADLPQLRMDNGDINRLAKFFPFDAQEGFDGQLEEINW